MTTAQPGVRVAAVLHYRDGHLVERLANPKYPQNLGKLRHVGGHQHAGETLAEALCRELKEELGISLDPQDLELDEREYTSLSGEVERRLVIRDHGLQPGTYTASIGGDRQVHLVYLDELDTRHVD